MLCRTLIDTRIEFYRQLASNPPAGKNYQPFLKGWLNRAFALWDFLNVWNNEPVAFSRFSGRKKR